MDEAGSRCRIAASIRPAEFKLAEGEIETIRAEKEAAIKAQDFEKAAALRDREKESTAKLENDLNAWRKKRDEIVVDVGEEDVKHVISKWTGIPLTRMGEGDLSKLLNIGETLQSRVIGQHEAVQALAKALRRSRADLKDPKRPIGSFIFLGPTGVGKTHLAKALAEEVFGEKDALVQLDMSEYMEKFNVSRLIGSPPGYVGYEEGGQLTEKVRRRPYCVVLFDEIEKAHPDVWNVLLQILEDGQVTDSLARKVDFRNTIIIMTSNVGAELIRKGNVMGFGTPVHEQDYNAIKEKILGETKKIFKPEFLNRLDDQIVFHSLTREDLSKIVSLEVAKVAARVREKGVEIELTPEASTFLIEKGYEPVYGARPLRRAIERYLEDPIAEEVIRGKIKAGDRVKVGADKENLTFTTTSPSSPAKSTAS
jgi:ATP-dependent Clp protease ATP-binding subunit ClpC